MPRNQSNGTSLNQRLKLAGAAILVLRASTFFQAASAALPLRSASTMHSGKLELSDCYIRYGIDGSLMWELPVSAIRVVGETTNQNGPYVDDYFLCFATGADSWYEASFYAEGRDEFLNSLERFLQCELHLSLVGSTDFASNVLWPPHLAGKPMFSFTPVQPTTWIGRLIGPMRITHTFADEVLTELRGEGRFSG